MVRLTSISMSQNNKLLLFAAFFGFLAIQIHVSSGFNKGVKRVHFDCPSCDVTRIPYNCTKVSSCGNILNITYPFRLEGDPPECGDPNYELSCENNQTILSFYSERFLVKAIDYYNSRIRIVDVGVQDSDCSSRPINSFESYKAKVNGANGDCSYPLYDFPLWYKLVYVSCESPVKSTTYVDTSPCITKSTNNNRRYHYVLVGDFKPPDLKVSCVIDFYTYTNLATNNNYSYMDIHKKLVYGVELSWFAISCAACRGEGLCSLENNTIIQSCTQGYCGPIHCDFRCKLKDFLNNRVPEAIHSISPTIEVLAPVLLTRTIFGFLCLFALVVYKWRRKHLSIDDTLEEFLRTRSQNEPPQRLGMSLPLLASYVLSNTRSIIVSLGPAAVGLGVVLIFKISG